MRWVVATVVVSLILLAVFFPRTRRVAAGALELRLVDRAGGASSGLHLVRVDGERVLKVLTSARIELAPGAHSIVVSPLRSTGARPMKLSLFADAAATNAVLEVPVGLGFFQRVLAPRNTPTPRTPVHVTATMPDGGRAAGAWYTCGDETTTLDDDGRGECDFVSPIEHVYVGIGAFGGSAGISQEDAHVTLGEATNFTPQLRNAPAVSPRGASLELTSLTHFVVKAFVETQVVMPGLMQEQAIACIDFDDVAVCDVIPADAGLYAPVLTLGRHGQITFQLNADAGAFVYLDRTPQPALDEPITREVAPGRHLLVVVEGDDEVRHERIIDVPAGGVVDLGTLPDSLR